jgi:hypothetical protein
MARAESELPTPHQQGFTQGNEVIHRVTHTLIHINHEGFFPEEGVRP